MQLTSDQKVAIIGAVIQAVTASMPRNVMENPGSIGERVEILSALLIGRIEDSTLL
jgi:hypothetical protein